MDKLLKEREFVASNYDGIFDCISLKDDYRVYSCRQPPARVRKIALSPGLRYRPETSCRKGPVRAPANQTLENTPLYQLPASSLLSTIYSQNATAVSPWGPASFIPKLNPKL